MITPPSPHPVYHDPIQTRRPSSSRRSVACLSRSASYLEAARAACPKDGDAFSYDPAYLHNWYLPQELWDRLPVQVQSSLAAVQHSGAAVLTGFARLDKHIDEFDGSHAYPKAPADELMVHLDDLPPRKFRTISNASSVFHHSDMSSPFTSGSSASESGSASPVMSALSLSQVMTPASPLCLGQSELSNKLNRTRERSFSTPLEPHDAYYTTELSHLRTEALPRLRHKSYKVDTEWNEAKRFVAVSAEDIAAFEAWWVEKKAWIISLNEKGKRLATAVGLANTGLGWCAP